jgi:3-phosphoshikimate 1-carboxyvinyltransferase
MLQTVFPGNYSGEIHIPTSKSDGQRALLAAALVNGKSYIYNLGNSKDELAMLQCIEQLGAKITWKGKELEVEGIKIFPTSLSLDCGESGLSSRLLIAVCAMHSGNFTITGEGSLLSRSMDFYQSLFSSQQMNFSFATNHSLPIQFQGGIQAGEIYVDGSQSSQYISGLLMGLPLLKEDSILIVENSVSLPYIQMTINTLNLFGVSIKQEGNRYFIKGNQAYKTTNYHVEGDWSSASYWLVASALGKGITVKDLSTKSLQADIAILQVFENAGCVVRNRENGLQIDGANRQPFEFDATNCPDLFPALATFAACIPGVSKISGVNRLQNKESDRGKVLQSEFEKLGVKIDLNGDEMLIYGQSTIKGGRINAHNDHRIAMCFGIIGMFTESPIEIEGAEAVSKSYPGFWEELLSIQI